MRRREFIRLIGGAVVVWPLRGRTQQPAAIGILQIGKPGSYDLSGFRQGLKDSGFLEGQNLTIEYRFANDDPNRLAELAADLVHRQVRVIVAIASTLSVRAAMAATSTIPILFGFGADPVQLGIVASLNRPEGNITGMTSMSGELVGKQLGILHELLPHAARFGVLINRVNPSQQIVAKDAIAAAPALGVTIESVTANNSDEIEAGLARLVDEKHVEGLLISNDPLFIERHDQIIRAIASYKLPAIYPFRDQAEAGGLMSYGPDLAARDRELAHYVGRILKGEKPGDLPVLRSTKFEFVVNLKTAKAIGLTFPPGRLATADEVIE